MWPGFGQNMRVLQWIAERTSGRASAGDSLLGLSPAYDDLNWEGLDFSREEYDALMAIDPERLVAECEEQGEYFQSIGDVPPELEAQRQSAVEKVRKAA